MGVILHISAHAYQRAKERLSFNAKTLERLALKAFLVGLKHTDTKGNLSKYITKLWFKNKSANNIRIYGENVYLFAGEVLVTLYQLPNDLRKHVKYCNKP